MISGQDGQFNVKGLDAGTYYLKEITPPSGYSACADKEIVISATHDVNHVSLSGESNLNNKIINKTAGGMMVAAIVLLVTKKRMENK